MCVCVCVLCVCVRACVRVCACVRACMFVRGVRARVFMFDNQLFNEHYQVLLQTLETNLKTTAKIKIKTNKTKT